MKLSIGDRIKVLGLLQGFKGTLLDIKVIKEVQDVVGLSEQDFEDYKIESAGGMLRWDDKVGDADLAIGGRGRRIIREMLEKKDKDKDLTVGDLSLWDIFVDEKDREEKPDVA